MIQHCNLWMILIINSVLDFILKFKSSLYSKHSRHDIAEILLMLALKINQSMYDKQNLEFYVIMIMYSETCVNIILNKTESWINISLNIILNKTESYINISLNRILYKTESCINISLNIILYKHKSKYNPL